LGEAYALGAYRRAHRLSDAQRHARGRLGVRDALFRTRTRYNIRARIRPASASAKRDASVHTRCSISSPPSAIMQI